jgi:hypothetical protein
MEEFAGDTSIERARTHWIKPSATDDVRRATSAGGARRSAAVSGRVARL